MDLPIKYGTSNLEELQHLENTLGFKLPKDYKEFLCRNNGGNFYSLGNWASVIIPDLNEKVDLGECYGYKLDEKYESVEIINVNKDFENDLPDNSIVFAQDPGGNMFLLICSGFDSGVYYWDHSHFYKSSNIKANTYKLSDSFSGFLNMIKYETD
jgi:hypothetical protein